MPSLIHLLRAIMRWLLRKAFKNIGDMTRGPQHNAIIRRTKGSIFRIFPKVSTLWIWFLRGWGRCLKVTLQTCWHRLLCLRRRVYIFVNWGKCNRTIMIKLGVKCCPWNTNNTLVIKHSISFPWSESLTDEPVCLVSFRRIFKFSVEPSQHYIIPNHIIEAANGGRI